MNTALFKLIILTAFVLFTLRSQAELFKWVDDKGKIHYSDTKPDEQTQTKVVPLKQNTSSSADQQSYSKAIIRPYEKTARKLFLLDTLYSWRKAAAANQVRKVGAYFVGKGCTSRGSMKVPDVLITHKALFPKESENAYRIQKIINSLDYEAVKSSKYKLLSNMKKTGGLSLHSEIVELDFDTCASSLSSRERLTKVNKISSYKFNKHRIKLGIRWQLKTNRDQDLLYEETTSGSYNGWNSTASASEAFAAAVESATIKLFSDQAFIDKILVEEDNLNLERVKIPKSQPVKSSGTAKNHSLYFSFDDQSWINNLKPGDAVGNLYFGDRCSAKKSLAMADASISHQWLLAKNNQPVLDVIKRIHALGYPIKPASGDVLASIMTSGGYSLQGELLGVSYDSCAPSLSAATKYMAIDKISGRKFNRNKVTVTINWKLKTEGNRKTLFETKTQGAAGSLLTDTDGSRAFNNAIVVAAEQLFSNSSFIGKITAPVERTGAMAPFPDVLPSSMKGLVRSKDSDVNKLFLVVENEIWKNLSVGSDIGLYAYGQDCTPFKIKKWPEALNDHPGLFPKLNEFLNAEARVLKSLDYNHQSTDQYNVVKLKRKHGGYSLHARVLELRFDSCAPGVRDHEIIKQNTRISSSQFKRHRVFLTIQWQLNGVSPENILYESITQGSADSWLLNSKAKTLVNMAVQKATENLFSDQKFLDSITNKKNNQQEDGFFSRIFSFGSTDTGNDLSSIIKSNYILKAHLSQAFVDMSQVKVMMAQHYYERGEWPYSLSDLGLSNANFSNNKSISDLSIQSDGSIIAELRDMFGSNKMLQLSPEIEGATNLSGISWQCSSNLTKDMLPANCETF